MNTRVFRCLLVASLALTTLANTFDMLFPVALSPGLQAAVAEKASLGLGSHSDWWLTLFGTMVVATLLSAVGLWRRERWGAWLGACVTGVGFAVMPAMGTYVLSGSALSIAQLAVGLWFIVLASEFMSRTKEATSFNAA